MAYGLYISAEGAAALSRRMQVTANNLANVATNGFKRDVAVFQARYAEEIERGQAVPGGRGLVDLGGGVELAETRTEHVRGPLRETKRPTDLSLDSEGTFFLVGDGEQQFLTRAGDFQLTATGELVTSDGQFSLLSSDLAPVRIDPENPDFRVTAEGDLEQAGATTPLAIVRPDDLNQLVKRGDNVYEALGRTQPAPQDERRVSQGFVEQSAVRPTYEMMSMIETSRAYEANVNLIKTQDQMMESLLSRVLRS